MVKRYTLGPPVYRLPSMYYLVRDGKQLEAWVTTAVVDNISNACDIRSGVFHGGIFNGGWYDGGVFHGGIFNGGEYSGGDYYGGVFFGGVFYGGCFYDGEFFDGSFWSRQSYYGGVLDAMSEQHRVSYTSESGQHYYHVEVEPQHD